MGTCSFGMQHWHAVIEIEILLQFHIVTHVDWYIA